MLDEKTTEPQQEMPSAPKPTARRGEKLRSLWARLQCVHLLRRHRFRRKTQHHMNNVSQKMRATPMVQTVGEGLYALGFSTEYAVVRAGRRVRAAALWVAAWFAALAHDLMVTAFPGAAQVLKDLFGPIVLFVRGCGALLVHAHRIHQEKGLGAALQASVHFFTNGIRRNLDAGKQTILLLNRRGYQTMAQCEDCREVLKCTKCSVPMVYHKAAHKVLCHYCGSQMEPPTVCPTCGGKLQYRGFGTQKAEEELAKLFPDARVLRMDQDSTAAKDAHEKLLARFANHEYDIMVGTQMVAKGLDFEDVTLVGVLGIDSLLFAQGFRAYENVFSLITQVVGRSGRARDPGFAIIQTTDPDNPVLNLAAAQDYDAFFEQEIAYRKLGLYPPFCGLCVIGFAGAKEIEVARAAARFAALLGQQAAKQPDLPLRVLGPTPGSIEKINDTYRYKLTIKCRNDRRFRDLVRSTLERYEQEKLPSKATVAVDLHSDGDI